ncbi:MAG: hypothetical protein IKF45_08715 [Lachnospiraceae bacterium]|nr:hypothetical protein [Lachnospiraceae bacterium]
MADNEKTTSDALWNLNIPPEEISNAAKQVDEIMGEIIKNYTAINDEVGVILHNWQGLAHDKHVDLFNEDAALYNEYIEEAKYDAFRMFVVSDAYSAVEQRNVERSGRLSSDIF